jgi:thiol-disulfide isomerase/thioredoxin
MTRNTQLFITILLIVAALAWMGRSFIRQLFPPAMQFAAAPLTRIMDGKATTIAEYRGKVVIVSCFQTWCIDCARETPVLNELAGKMPADQFRVVYVSDEPVDKIAGFNARFSSGNIVFTQSPQSLSTLGISVFPTTYLMNKKGEVVKTRLEGYDWMQEEATIRQLLAE